MKILFRQEEGKINLLELVLALVILVLAIGICWFFLFSPAAYRLGQ